MEQAEERKARLAAIRERAKGAGASASTTGGGLVTPQMLGATAPPPFLPTPAQQMAPMPAQAGFFTAMQTPTGSTPIIASFSMGDRAQPPPQRPPPPGGPPPFQHRGGFRGGNMMMGRGRPQPPPPPGYGSGDFHGGMTGGMPGGPLHRGQSCCFAQPVPAPLFLLSCPAPSPLSYMFVRSWQCSLPSGLVASLSSDLIVVC
jgi:hypothetical protein